MKKTKRVWLRFLGIALGCQCIFTAMGLSLSAAEEMGEDFIAVSESLLPFKNRMVSIELRDTPLRDTLYSIVSTAGLNLILERGVDPNLPITLSIKDISAEEAIQLILNAAGYFYRLQGNVLSVKAMDTKVFEFGQPSVTQAYSVLVGGDILGAAMKGAEDFGGGGEGGGGGSGGGGEDSMKGLVEQRIASDPDAFNLWNSIASALKQILGTGEGSGAMDGSGMAERSYFDINRMTGTIIVTASRQKLETVERYLDSVKASLSRQVVIEARIVEVTLAKGLKYGIDWTWLASDSVTIEANNFRGVISPTKPNVQVHVSRGDFEGVLRAIESQGQIRTLSNPRVNIMNGQTALLSVGRSQTFLSSIESEVSTGDKPIVTFTTNTSSVLSGIMVGIVPYINERGEVSMTITPIISELIDMEERPIGDQGTSISLPTVDLRQLSTTVKVSDGDMIVIGGLMQSRKKAQDEQVPFLGNIPLLGYLFKQYDDTDTQTDIVIMLKPMLNI